ncbi:MAG: hypothetical protein IPM85_11690 [Chitinophagaceae bacterium]|nr:hypothetical protein [Chitinophagaceae bacterium]
MITCLKDHLGNVRMVLTEEQKQDISGSHIETPPTTGGTAIKEDDFIP